MDRNTEGDSQTLQFYKNGVQLIESDVSLGFTFLEVARVEFQSGDSEQCARSLYHGQRAHLGAQEMLGKLPKLEAAEKARLQGRIDELGVTVDSVAAEIRAKG